MHINCKQIKCSATHGTNFCGNQSNPHWKTGENTGNENDKLFFRTDARPPTPRVPVPQPTQPKRRHPFPGWKSILCGTAILLACFISSSDEPPTPSRPRCVYVPCIVCKLNRMLLFHIAHSFVLVEHEDGASHVTDHVPAAFHNMHA